MFSEALNVASIRKSKIASVTGEAKDQDDKPFWECVTPIIDNPYYDPDYKYDPDAGDYYDRESAEKKTIAKDSIYGDRNYRLFTLLANVRNYEHGEGNLFPVRGAPDDITDEIAEELDSWSSDAHSVSWITVAELEPFRQELNAVAPNFMTAIDRLRASRPHNTEDEIRIVFWFDN